MSLPHALAHPLPLNVPHFLRAASVSILSLIVRLSPLGRTPDLPLNHHDLPLNHHPLLVSSILVSEIPSYLRT
jgi:hypothetical protein